MALSTIMTVLRFGSCNIFTLATYALALVWDVAGLVDLLLAAGVTTYGGIFGAVNNFFGPGIVLLPIDIVLHFVILALLLGSPVARHFAGKSG